MVGAFHESTPDGQRLLQDYENFIVHHVREIKCDGTSETFSQIPSPSYGPIEHYKAHDGRYTKAIKKDGFTKAYKRVCEMFHGWMPQWAFDILLILVTSSKNRTKEENLEELVKNRTEYQMQNPNWRIKAQEFCDRHGFDIDGNDL